MSENNLINRLQQKDEEAFRIVFNQNQRKVINTCYRLVLDKDAAQDITQEVFIKLYSSIDQFRGESRLSTWIYRIAVSKSLDYLRAQKRKKRHSLISIFSEPYQKQEEISAPKNQNPSNILDDEERKRILNDALSKLPENQKIAFLLSKYDELSTKEIADILDTSIHAVESLIQRAKKNLAKKLYSYF
jgi:RNA polymerase sigma-70 factor, ECF subfamily